MRDLHGDARQSPDCYIVDPGSGKTYRTIVEIEIEIETLKIETEDDRV